MMIGAQICKPGVLTMLKYAAKLFLVSFTDSWLFFFYFCLYDMYPSGSIFAQSGLQTRRGTSVSCTIIIIARGVSCTEGVPRR